VNISLELLTEESTTKIIPQNYSNYLTKKEAVSKDVNTLKGLQVAEDAN